MILQHLIKEAVHLGKAACLAESKQHCVVRDDVWGDALCQQQFVQFLHSLEVLCLPKCVNEDIVGSERQIFVL